MKEIKRRMNVTVCIEDGKIVKNYGTIPPETVNKLCPDAHARSVNALIVMSISEFAERGEIEDWE